MIRAIVPGSFDPLTNGHMDIIERASRLFDEVIVVIGTNLSKAPMFSVVERVAIAAEAVSHLPNVKVDSTSGLIVDYAARHDCAVIVKGLRDQQDFTEEHELEGNNKFINPKIETIYLAATKLNVSTRSSSIKGFLKYGVDVSSLVPPATWKAIQNKHFS